MKLKLVLLSLLTSVLCFAPAAVLAQSASKSAVCNGIGVAADANGNCTPQAGTPTIDGIIKLTVNLLSIAVGLIAVIAIIIAGLRFITSGGDATTVSNAKKTILYAIVGLVIVALAQVIVKFTLNRVTHT